MKRLLPITLAALLAACTFDPDLTGGDYWPCDSDFTCPQGCECLEGQVCIPTGDLEPKLCAWCPEGYTLCDMHLPKFNGLGRTCLARVRLRRKIMRYETTHSEF